MQLRAVWLCLARLCGWVGTGWTGTMVYCYRHQVQSRRQVLIGSAQIFLIGNIAYNERNTLTDKENHLFYLFILLKREDTRPYPWLCFIRVLDQDIKHLMIKSSVSTKLG